MFSPPLEFDNDSGLLTEPDGFCLPLRPIRRPLEIEMTKDLRNKLAHLEDGDVLPDAGAGGAAELRS